MQSRNQVRPEQMQSAYNAASAGTGGPSPILNDAMLNLLESFGYAPPAAAPPTGPGTGPDDLGPRPPAGVLDPSQLPVGLPHRGGDGGLHATPGRDRQGPPSAPGSPRPPRLPTDPIGPGPGAPGSPSSGVLPGSLPGGDPLAALQTQAGGVPPPPRDRAPYMPGMGFGNGPSDIGPQNTFWDVNMSGPPNIPPGMEDILAGYLNGGGGMGGGNPDTVARFREFQRRKQQMQPPIMPAGQGY
jgi:hypothetical protein